MSVTSGNRRATTLWYGACGMFQRQGIFRPISGKPAIHLMSVGGVGCSWAPFGGDMLRCSGRGDSTSHADGWEDTLTGSFIWKKDSPMRQVTITYC